MASPLNAALCALLAAAFWTVLGTALGRRLLPRALGRGAAPIIGWAVHSAVMLPIYAWIGPSLGFSPIAVLGAGALCVLASGLALSAGAPQSQAEDAADIPAWAFAAAAVLAVVPAVAILPKFSGDAVLLADPIFDHSKIAIVDAMARLGLPPVNPVFGEFGALGHLAYYYLWHFSAAELALALGASGWEADIGLTWFTAFASLSVMMGVAVWLGKRAAAAIWVVVLAAAASLWVTLDWIAGARDLTPWLWPPVGMAGWLFQATWVPQHLMAASCAVTAMLLISGFAQRQSPALLAVLVLIVVAGFESSSFVGGVAFAIAALIAAPMLLVGTEPAQRRRFAIGLAVAAALAVCLAAPFVLDQLAALRARGAGSAIVVDPYTVLGEAFPYTLRRLLDLPAYWLVLLPIELPAAYVAGALALAVALRSAMPHPERLALAALACLAGTGLIVSWLLVSTLGENNDLGLRAIIPAEMVLIVAAAAGFFHARCRAAIVATALAGLLLSLPDTVAMISQQHRRRAEARRPNLGANARTVGRGEALRSARRAGRQQSAVPPRRHPLAGEHFLGVARQPQFLLCRARNGARLRAAAAAATRRDRYPVHPCLCRRGHRGRRERHGDALWLRGRRRRAARQSLEQRPVRREPRLSLGGKPRRPLADLRAGEVKR